MGLCLWLDLSGTGGKQGGWTNVTEGNQFPAGEEEEEEDEEEEEEEQEEEEEGEQVLSDAQKSNNTIDSKTWGMRSFPEPEKPPTSPSVERGGLHGSSRLQTQPGNQALVPSSKQSKPSKSLGTHVPNFWKSKKSMEFFENHRTP